MTRINSKLKRPKADSATLEEERKLKLLADLAKRRRLSMQSDVPEKLLRIANEIRELGSAHTTRLTIIKRWFRDHTRRLPALAILVASRAANREAKVTREAADLFQSARALLGGHPPVVPRRAAQRLHEDLREFQNEHKRTAWGMVRVLKNHDLFLVEEGLGIYLRRIASSADGYRLVAAFCAHYDSRCGNGLNGPSSARIREIVEFMRFIEDPRPTLSAWTESRKMDRRRLRTSWASSKPRRPPGPATWTRR